MSLQTELRELVSRELISQEQAVNIEAYFLTHKKITPIH